jgi:hypothetical protein
MGRAGSTVAPILLFYTFHVSFGSLFTLLFRPMTLIVGQVETLMPELLQAMSDAAAAKQRVDCLKAQMISVIGEPQTVKTCWGSVTVNKGKRTVKVTDRALTAQITLLKEQGIALGKCEESVGEYSLTVRKTDR